MKILLATYPFGQIDQEARDMLIRDGNTLVENPYRRRLKKGEVGKLLEDCDVVIAGTEPYAPNELQDVKDRLKLISRVGIGLDSVDMEFCKQHGIRVAYTPDAPSQAVAELTIHHMLALCRNTIQSNQSVIDYTWKRDIGFLLKERKIGILGVGRIGKKVIRILKAFNAQVKASDPNPDMDFFRKNELENVSAQELFSSCDMVSIHIPLNKDNHHFVDRTLLEQMPDNAYIINTSRGPVLDESDLLAAYNKGIVAKAALDVFSHEPYMGPMLKMNEAFIFSAHIGASARESRREMELQAARAVLAFKHNKAWNDYVV